MNQLTVLCSILRICTRQGEQMTDENNATKPCRQAFFRNIWLVPTILFFSWLVWIFLVPGNMTVLAINIIASIAAIFHLTRNYLAWQKEENSKR